METMIEPRIEDPSPRRRRRGWVIVLVAAVTAVVSYVVMPRPLATTAYSLGAGQTAALPGERHYFGISLREPRGPFPIRIRSIDVFPPLPADAGYEIVAFDGYHGIGALWGRDTWDAEMREREIPLDRFRLDPDDPWMEQDSIAIGMWGDLPGRYAISKIVVHYAAGPWRAKTTVPTDLFVNVVASRPEPSGDLPSGRIRPQP